MLLAGCATAGMAPLYYFLFSGKYDKNTMLLYKDTDVVSSEQIKRVKRSSAYRFAEKIALGDGLKKRWSWNTQKLAAWLKNNDQSKARKPPAQYYRKFGIKEITVNQLPCYFMSPSGDNGADPQNTGSVILYFHGGGFIYEMHQMHWVFVQRILDAARIPVCIPMYPIYPRIDPEAALQFMLACYKELLSRYPAANIIALGDSAGADLNMSFWHYIYQHKIPAPFPEKIILISPAMAAGNDESIIEKMKEIETHDVMLSMDMFGTLHELFQFPAGELNYWTAPLYGDFCAFPPIYVFSGTYDIFYPQVKPFVDRVRSQGKRIEFWTGQEMMHDWPVVPAVGECEAAFSKILEIINGKEGS
jgi:acetyl esterase/lipase